MLVEANKLVRKESEMNFMGRIILNKAKRISGFAVAKRNCETGLIVYYIKNTYV